jgi:outer membrane protein assembly factor BamE
MASTLIHSPRCPAACRGLALTLVASLLLGGCSLPRLYRATIQQGNVITQDMVNQLEPGMTRNQVAFIMGEPILRNSFSSDRWDYLYRVEVPGYYEEEKRLTLFFDDGTLFYFTGDYLPESATDDPASLQDDEVSLQDDEVSEQDEASAVETADRSDESA